MNDLQRALRHLDLNELADAVDQCYQQGVELTDLPTKYPIQSSTPTNDDELATAPASTSPNQPVAE